MGILLFINARIAFVKILLRLNHNYGQLGFLVQFSQLYYSSCYLPPGLINSSQAKISWKIYLSVTPGQLLLSLPSTQSINCLDSQSNSLPE